MAKQKPKNIAEAGPAQTRPRSSVPIRTNPRPKSGGSLSVREFVTAAGRTTTAGPTSAGCGTRPPWRPLRRAREGPTPAPIAAQGPTFWALAPASMEGAPAVIGVDTSKRSADRKVQRNGWSSTSGTLPMGSGPAVTKRDPSMAGEMNFFFYCLPPLAEAVDKRAM